MTADGIDEEEEGTNGAAGDAHADDDDGDDEVDGAVLAAGRDTSRTVRLPAGIPLFVLVLARMVVPLGMLASMGIIDAGEKVEEDVVTPPPAPGTTAVEWLALL